MKINVALERLPNFTALPGHEPGPQHFGTVHLCPDQDFIERAYDDAKYGRLSREPVVECTMPSSLDSTVAPPGKHLMSMFTQYAPYELKSGPGPTSCATSTRTAASTSSNDTRRASKPR